LANHFAFPSPVPHRIAHLLGGHSAFHCMSCGEGGVSKLAGRRAIKSTVYEDDFDLWVFLD
jgi:hypothetical protein